MLGRKVKLTTDKSDRKDQRNRTEKLIDSTKIAKTADGISNTVEHLQTELAKVKDKVSDVQQAVAPVVVPTKNVTAVSQDKTSLNTKLDKDGNIVN